MSEQKHTPEPWIYDEPSNWQGMAFRLCNEKYDPIGQIQIAGWSKRTARANAERIVSCVNALAGMQPEAVARLVEALSRSIAALRERVERCPDDPYYESDLDFALAALAAVKGGAE